MPIPRTRYAPTIRITTVREWPVDSDHDSAPRFRTTLQNHDRKGVDIIAAVTAADSPINSPLAPSLRDR